MASFRVGGIFILTLIMLNSLTISYGQIEICKTTETSLIDYMDKHVTAENKTLLFSYLELNWSDARDHCKRLGANLVKINSKETNEEIGKYLTKRTWGEEEPYYHWKYFYHWIGGYKNDGKWYWVKDNSTILDNFTSFNDNSPKDGSTEECLEILQFNAVDYKVLWNDGYCEIQRPFICEM